MRKFYFISAILLIINISCNSTNRHKKATNGNSSKVSQTRQNNNSFTVMFYNVENLFDTINTPDVYDQEFTPESEKHWNTKRYNKKLNDLAGVVSRINGGVFPDIMGMSEVENKQVVADLINTEKLKAVGYGIVHEDSPDGRGIDVALIYKKSSFEYQSHQAMAVHIKSEPKFKSRDILYVKGQAGGETLHIFVNHWKSRRGGPAETEFKRIASAEVLRKKVNEIQKENPEAKIIIIGDFNDTPENKSIFETLNATGNLSDPKPGELFNLMYQKSENHLGTNSYKNQWFMLDNIIVSHQLLNDTKGWHTTADAGTIYDAPSVMYKNKKTKQSTPSKTYGGKNYYGGISDHLAVFFTMTK